MADEGKGFWFRLRVFGWYLLTEPYRQSMEVVRSFRNIFSILQKSTTSFYVTMLVAVVGLLVGNLYMAAGCAALLFVLMLVHEWQSGFFMKRYRECYRKRLERKVVFKDEERKI